MKYGKGLTPQKRNMQLSIKSLGAAQPVAEGSHRYKEARTKGLAAQRQNTPGLARPPRRRRKGRTMQGHAVAKTVRSALLVGLSVLLLSGCGLLGRNVDTGPTPEAAKGVVRTAYAQMGKTTYRRRFATKRF